MIYYIQGTITAVEPTFIVIETNGIGYFVHISLNTYSEVKDRKATKIYTYFHVREDHQSLYGFATEQERTVFLQLISISGVGPNTGIVLLSFLTTEEIISAIANGDVATIQSVKGIGSKTAQRIILELKDKVGKLDFATDTTSPSVSQHNTIKAEALSALMTLGIPKTTAEKTIDRVLKSADNALSLEEVIKQALKMA